MKTPARTTAYIAATTALAIVLSYVETLIPINLGVPGAKLGLPNIVTLFLLYNSGLPLTCAVSVLRIVLTGFMFGNVSAIIYSLAGFVFSVITMYFLKRSKLFDMNGVSVGGAVMHNMGQLLIAAAVTNSSVFTYLPFLVLAGIGAGIVVGIIGAIIYKRISQFNFQN